MKRKALLFIFLLNSLSVFAQKQPEWEGTFMGADKRLHFAASMGITMVAVESAKDFQFKNPELTGLVVGFSVGIMKEFVMDINQSSRDLLIDFTGCIAGVLVNRLINGRIEIIYIRKGWNANNKVDKHIRWKLERRRKLG